MSLPEKSKHVCASEPSSEFPYTWFDLDGDRGSFFATINDAIDEAKTNYLDFTGSFAKRTVYVVQVIDVLGKP